VLRVMTGTLVILIALTLVANGRYVRTAESATGDQLREITVPVTGGTATSIEYVGGGTLVYSNWGDPNLYHMTADGTLTKTVPTGFTLYSLSWDAGRTKLWACAGGQVYLLDKDSGASTFMFNGECFDGLAYDATDDTLYMSFDANCPIYHRRASDGGLIRTISCTIPNSGIVVGNPDLLYLGGNGDSNIYKYNKGGDQLGVFAHPGGRVEDLTCDPDTFAGKHAIWSKDAYDNTVTAFEVDLGTCFAGGGVPPPRSVALGDSVPTGHSVSSFNADPFSPATNGYPTRLNQFLQSVRPGIQVNNLAFWGYTAQQVIDTEVFLLCFFGCPKLVTITVGANDFHFSDVLHWHLRRGNSRQQHAAEHAVLLRPILRNLIDEIRERVPDAEIFITNYYNPADPRACRTFFREGEDILWAGNLTGLNEVIQQVAGEKAVHFVDIYNQFRGHAIESASSYLFGTECDIPRLLRSLNREALADPHPNALGQQCIANLIWESAKVALGSVEAPVADPCP